jgi:hypothetical protein
MPCDVFLSYTRIKEGNLQLITHFHEELQRQLRERAGLTISIFRDTEGIEAGDNWSEVLQENIKTAKIFLFLLSPTWLMSKWCVDEYKWFRDSKKSDHSKRLFPVIWTSIREGFLNDDAKALLSEVQQYQWFKWEDLQYLDPNSSDVQKAVGDLADKIADQLELAIADARRAEGGAH